MNIKLINNLPIVINKKIGHANCFRHLQFKVIVKIKNTAYLMPNLKIWHVKCVHARSQLLKNQHRLIVVVKCLCIDGSINEYQ